MTAAEGHASQPSPWLSVWFNPRQTIERRVAANPRRFVLLLAPLGTIAALIPWLIRFRSATELIDWRNLAIVAIVGSAYGLVSLYINGLLYRWSGRILGGRASSVEVRAAFAWGSMPNIIGLAISLFALTSLKLAGASDSTSYAPIVALQVITGVLGCGRW